MAFTHGKKAYFGLDNSGGTITNIRPYTDSVSGLPGARNLSEVTAFGDEGARWIAGLVNATFSAGGSWDNTESTGLHAVLAGVYRSETPISFEYGPAGNASGAVKLTGECWVTSYTVDASVADKVPWSAEFQVDGVVTIGTFT